MSEDAPIARIAELERELAWQADHVQHLERQLTAVLDRTYQLETTNARLWAALGLLAATGGEETGVVASDLATPAWPKVADEVASLLQTLSNDGTFAFAPPGAALGSNGIAVPPLNAMNVQLRELGETPAMARPAGRPLLADPVSLIPSAARVHHAANTGAIEFTTSSGSGRVAIHLLCRSREIPYLRVTIKPDRTRPPSHLMIETSSGRAVQQLKTPNVRIGLTGADLHDGWAQIALLVETTGVEQAPIQFALSEAPSAFLTHFAGRDGQALDLAWIVAAPVEADEAPAVPDCLPERS